ncbi:hypothetical protein [Planctomicrobium sp. SH664]|uniref:hypothetical protein n=1 Tax=Planctomicrobium sp. SH664 TaxID=3448125 RepID=UPI003F5B8D76
MPSLNATLRNDHLRISLQPLNPGASTQQLDAEFSQLLATAPACKAIIIDLFGSGHVPAAMVALLAKWQLSAQSEGRRFRLNGISTLVNSVNQQLRRSKPTEEPRALAG